MAEETTRKKEFYGVDVHRTISTIVLAIAQETGAPVIKILEELAAQLTPAVFKAVRDKLRPAAGALEAALGEKPEVLAYWKAETEAPAEVPAPDYSVESAGGWLHACLNNQVTRLSYGRLSCERCGAIAPVDGAP